MGFTTAAALTIGSSQIKSLLGLNISTNGFVQSWINVWTHISKTKWEDALLGVSTMVVLLFLKVDILMNFLKDTNPSFTHIFYD